MKDLQDIMYRLRSDPRAVSEDELSFAVMTVSSALETVRSLELSQNTIEEIWHVMYELMYAENLRRVKAASQTNS